MMAGCEGELVTVGGGGGGQLPPVMKTWRDRSDLFSGPEGNTSDVRVADLNSDAKLDVIWVHQPSLVDDMGGDVQVSFNELPNQLRTVVLGGDEGLGPWLFVEPIDVDGDTDVDLVLSRAVVSGPGVTLVRNNGSGDFERIRDAIPVISGENEGIIFSRVAAADIDGDKDQDLIVPTFSNIRFEPGVNGAPIYDAGRPDLLLLNDGAGNFALDTQGRLPTVSAQEDATLCIATGDVNGDGAVDLFFTEVEAPPHEHGVFPRLLINNGTGYFSNQTNGNGAGMRRLPQAYMRGQNCEMADIDGDMDLDIVLVNDAEAPTGNPPPPPAVSGNFVYRNNGSGVFMLEMLPSAAGKLDTRGLSVADINADGHIDVAIGNATETVSNNGVAVEVLFGKGDGTFTPMQGMPTYQVGVFGVALGDLNGDRYADIAAAVNEPGSRGTLGNILLLSE